MSEPVTADTVDTTLSREALPPWLRPELDRLLALHDAGRLHHALLLTGRSGLGKRLLAGALARALLCRQAPGAPRPCGDCRGCQLTAGQSHPDLRRLVPEAGSERSEILVDSARSLVDFLHLSPQMGGARVAVIVPCDRLNRAAANSLLKSLEEPPPGVFLILATGRPGRLPPTVRSRCAVRSLGPPDAGAAERWLTERTEAGGTERIRRALALAGGMPLAAERLLAQDGLASYELLLQQLQRLAAGGDPVQEAERWEQAPAELADGAAAILADLLRQQHGAPDRGLLPADLARQLAARGSPEALHQAFLRISEHRRSLDQPLNGRLAAEAICLDLAAALRGGYAPSRQ